MTKNKDKSATSPAVKNGSASAPYDCAQSVSSAEYQQAIKHLSEQIHQMTKSIAGTQGVIEKSLKPMVEVSQVMAEVVKSHNEQIRQFSIPLRELLLSFSEQGWTSGNTTVKITTGDAKKNSIAVEATKTINKGDIERQQTQTFNAELVGDSRRILENIQRTVEKELSLEDIEKWLDKNGMKAVSVKIKSLVRQASTLFINGVAIVFIAGSKQDRFVGAFFEDDKLDKETNDYGLDVDELCSIIDSKNDPEAFKKGARKRYQDLKRAINKEVQAKSGLADFILFEEELGCWKINPKYLT